jgi:hypothetical protein
MHTVAKGPDARFLSRYDVFSTPEHAMPRAVISYFIIIFQYIAWICPATGAPIQESWPCKHRVGAKFPVDLVKLMPH